MGLPGLASFPELQLRAFPTEAAKPCHDSVSNTSLWRSWSSSTRGPGAPAPGLSRGSCPTIPRFSFEYGSLAELELLHPWSRNSSSGRVPRKLPNHSTIQFRIRLFGGAGAPPPGVPELQLRACPAEAAKPCHDSVSNTALWRSWSSSTLGPGAPAPGNAHGKFALIPRLPFQIRLLGGAGAPPPFGPGPGAPAPGLSHGSCQTMP